MKLPNSVIVLIFVGIVFGLVGIGTLMGLFAVEQVDEEGRIVGDGGQIIIEDNPDEITLNFNDVDKEKPSNDPAGKLRIYDPDKGNVSDDGTSTLALKTDYKAIAEIGSTTYYGQVADFNSGTNKQLYVQPEVVKAGTLTVSVFNSDDDQPNSASDTQAIAANDEGLEVEVCYDVTSNLYWGAPNAEGNSVVTVAYNQSVINSIEVVDASRGDAPADYNRQTNITAEETWKIPNLVDGIKNCFMLNIDATSSEPGTEHTIDLLFYDANVDLEQSKRIPVYDIEDEDNNLLSIKPANKTIFIG